MKVNKKQGLLYIFHLLLTHQTVDKEKIMNELKIQEHSFWRYMQEIRAFIANFFLPYEIKYSRIEKVYYLIKN